MENEVTKMSIELVQNVLQTIRVTMYRPADANIKIIMDRMEEILIYVRKTK